MTMSNITPEQQEILDQLPDKTGWYWVNRFTDGYERPVRIDKASVTGETCGDWLINDGVMINGSACNLHSLRLWLEINTVLAYIEPFKHPDKPAYFGMF